MILIIVGSDFMIMTDDTYIRVILLVFEFRAPFK